jgi:hypothetical protein
LKVSGAQRKQIIDLLLQHPDGMSLQAIADRIYADDPDGGPDFASNSIWAMVARANVELADQGHRITSTKGRGSVYRIVKL